MQLKMNGSVSVAHTISSYLKSLGYSKHEFSWMTDRLDQEIIFDYSHPALLHILNNIKVLKLRTSNIAAIESLPQTNFKVIELSTDRPANSPKFYCIIIFDDAAIESFIKLTFSGEITYDS